MTSTNSESEVAIDICKRLDKALWMTRWCASIPLCKVSEEVAAVTHTDMLLWAVVPLGNQDVRLHLSPLHTTLLAIHAKTNIVSLTRSNLRSLQQSCEALIGMHKCTSIIIHRTTRRYTLQVGTNLCNLCTCDILHQVPSVSSDITHTATLTSLLWVVTPHGVITALKLNSLREPALCIFHKYTTHLADYTISNSTLHLLHRRITAVNVSQSQRQTSLLHLLTQRQSLLQSEGHRLVQHHIKAQLQGSCCRGIMEAVRGYNGHEIHSFILGQSSLLLKHLLPGVVDTILWHKVLTSRA